MTIPQTEPRSSINWPNVQRAAIITAVFGAFLWVIEGFDYLMPMDLDSWGVVSWSPTGFFPGLLFMPVLHAGWEHLISNSVPIIVLGFLAAVKGLRTFFTATGIILVVTGVGVWLTSTPGVVTVGASGMIFGYFGYLIARGVFHRSLSDFLIALCVIVGYGSIIWGIFPSQPQISWQAHLFGFVGGVIAAWRLRRKPVNPAGATAG